ncbi:MAG: nucleotidyltransferase domain-containing protein [Chloroflexota bacterium]
MEPAKQLTRLCEKYALSILYAFGSRGQAAARFILSGEAMPPGESDLDIGVLPRNPLSVKGKVQLALDLETLFDVSRVDLVVLPEADPFLAANVIRGERLYANDSYLADEYDLYILRRAGDLAPLERERMALILEKKS